MKSKKLLTGILSAAMVLGSMSLTALAEETDVYAVGAGKTYADLASAFAADAVADSDNNGVITYAIYGKVDLGTSGWASPVKAGSAINTVNFVGMTNDAEIVIETTNPYTSIDSYQVNDSLIAMNFKDLACSRPHGGWVNDLGHAGNYFVATLRNHGATLGGTVTYENCTFANGVCNNFYGKTNFIDCNFENASEYGLWIYGGETTVNGDRNTFTGAKGVKVYSENAAEEGINVTIENATFDITDKPAIVSSMASTIILNDVDATACAKGLLSSEPKDKRSDLPYADITVDGEAPVFAAKVGAELFTDRNAAEAEANKNPASPKTVETIVAQIGCDAYTTLEAAVNAAQNGDTVKLLSDTVESVTITAGKTLTLDLNGHKLTNAAGKHTIENYGALTVRDTSDDKTAAVDNVTNGKSPLVNYEGGSVTLDGGSFVRSLENSKVGSTEDCNSCYTIKNWGVMTINSGVTVENGSNNERGSSAIGNGYYNGTNFDGHSGVTAESVKVKLTINGGTFVGGLHTIKNDDRAELEVNGGTFSNPANYSIFNVNKAVINNGTFTGGHYGTAYNRFYAGGMNAGELTIKGGEFNGKIVVYNPAKAATLISGGTFSTDVSAYTAPGFAAKKVGDKWIVDDSAVALTLGFKETTDARVYDIVVTAADETKINRLNTADLTFALTATSADDSTVTYEILPVTGITVTSDNANANRYMFNFNGKDAGVVDTGKEIKIGQVRFEGYTKNGAKITFSTDIANSLVTATSTDGENLVTYFGSEAGLTADTVNKIENVKFAVPTKKLTVNITFPNAIADQVADYQDMKVVISGSDLAENLVYKLGTGENAIALEGGAYKLVVDGKLTENTAYTVTVSGAGYRTARYTVTMNENKTLNFWNNVKDTPTVVEEGKDASKKSVTFLAGDIVKDGKINIYDLSAVVSYFGTINDVSAESAYAKYDLNRDGKIDSKDVAYVLVSWGK